jgi:hypothetical protein
MKERKRRGGSHTRVFSNALGLLPSCNSPSGELTRMGTSPTNKRQRHGIFVIFINSFKWKLGFYHGTNLTLPGVPTFLASMHSSMTIRARQ